MMAEDVSDFPHSSTRTFPSPSTAESLVVHVHSEDSARMEDFLSEVETDVEDSKPPVLSRSHSAEGLRVMGSSEDDLPRRNSSGECSSPSLSTPRDSLASWREDDFSLLLQATAERVISRLKSRQKDLSPGPVHALTSRRPSLGPQAPRKLQPILRLI